MRNSLAMYLAIAAGIMLLGVGVSGGVTWETIRNFVVNLLGDHWALILIFQALVFIASLGGISVIAGGVLIGAGRTSTGKLFIMLGTGMGLFGFLIAIAIPGLLQGSAALALGTTTGFVGVVLSLVARMVAK